MIPDLKREKRDNLLSLFSLFIGQLHRNCSRPQIVRCIGNGRTGGTAASKCGSRPGQSLLEWYEALISAALVLVLVFSFFFRIIQVDGESMVPTLENGDKLIVWGAGYEPQRGDVVIVDSYTCYGRPLVKRVIAKGGDTISHRLRRGRGDGERGGAGGGLHCGAHLPRL